MLRNRRALALLTLSTAALVAVSGPSAIGATKTTKKSKSTATTKESAASTEAPTSAAPATTAAPAKAAALPAGVPRYYPANYGDLVEDSKKEPKLQVYSILSKANWAPVLAGFQKRYPWIDVDASDNDSATIFDKYYTETAGGARSADMIVTSSPDTWQEFVKKGEAVPYKSPEDSKVPAWSKLAPGVYTVSSDPMLLIWNKKLLPQGVRSMEQLSAMVKADPSRFTPGRIVTYVETNATGFAAYWFWGKKLGQGRALSYLDTMGKTKPKAETSGGRMVDSTISGETLVGVFVSSVTVFPKFPAANDILGWSYVTDGTPLIVRGMGLTKKAKAPASAKLLMDYILSAEGQIALADGGVTPYRPDVAKTAKLHLQAVQEEVRESNLIPFSFDPDLLNSDKREGFRALLKESLGR